MMNDLSKKEELDMENTCNCNKDFSNTGSKNKGGFNSGDSNEGCMNSGDNNVGHFNSGDYNEGNRNSGCCNVGHCNAGENNIGNSNTGDRNNGNRNSGSFNSGVYLSGHFNTKTPVYMFNKEVSVHDIVEVLFPDYMKAQNPDIHDYKEAWIDSWDSFASDEEKLQTINLPNFCPDVFFKITGIDVRKEAFEGNSYYVEAEG